jgi:hypothetical protein
MSFFTIDRRLDLSPILSLEYLFKYYKGWEDYKSWVILKDSDNKVIWVSNFTDNDDYEVLICDWYYKEDFIFVNWKAKSVKPFKIDRAFGDPILKRGLFYLNKKADYEF